MEAIGAGNGVLDARSDGSKTTKTRIRRERGFAEDLRCVESSPYSDSRREHNYIGQVVSCGPVQTSGHRFRSSRDRLATSGPLILAIHASGLLCTKSGDGERQHKCSFIQCGLRLYIGERAEQAIQCVRLEWVAPTSDSNGADNYEGKHAGHPHWHIDQSALFGQEDYVRSLESLTAPVPQTGPEDFSGVMPEPSRPLIDFSWLQRIHFPARAQWMQSEWDGLKIPGPHQCEPNTLDELTHWWAGALRYFFHRVTPLSGELSSIWFWRLFWRPWYAQPSSWS